MSLKLKDHFHVDLYINFNTPKKKKQNQTKMSPYLKNLDER